MIFRAAVRSLRASLMRRSEIGLRLALGASAFDVTQLVVGGGIRPIAIGVAVGLTACLFATRAMQGLLYGVSTFDGATVGGAVALFAAIAVAATLLPARRASAIDPATSLRQS